MNTNERELVRLVIEVRAKNGMTSKRMDRSLARLGLEASFSKERHLG